MGDNQVEGDEKYLLGDTRKDKYDDKVCDERCKCERK